jgi:ribosome modulation factor
VLAVAVVDGHDGHDGELTFQHRTFLEVDVRKNSARARTIHGLMHDMLDAIARGDARGRNRALQRALDLHTADIGNGGLGYSLRWLCELAEQHPDALAARPDLAVFLERYRTQRRSYIHGKRNYTGGFMRQSNPYCSYTNEDAYESWYAGWDDACNLAGDDAVNDDC